MYADTGVCSDISVYVLFTEMQMNDTLVNQEVE